MVVVLEIQQIENHMLMEEEERIHTVATEANSRKKKVLLGLILALILAGIALDYVTNRYIEHACVSFIHWVEAHPFLGIMAVIVVYALATILFIPGAILTVGCGYAFRTAFDSTVQGVFFASVAVFIGAYIGSICSFLLGRYLFQDCVLQLASQYPILKAIDAGEFYPSFLLV